MKDFDLKRRNFLIFSSVSTFVLLTGCDNKIDLSPRKIYFDRDVCERCKMVVSVKNYVAQVVNPNDGKYYNFDDLGCAVNWFEEKNISWQNEAVIYISDAETSKMIDAKKAFYVDKMITPMDFGFAAYKNEQSGKNNFKYDEIKIKMIEFANEKKKSMSHNKH